MSDTTIVTACNKKFLWGAFLLVASLRSCGVQNRVHVLARGLSSEDAALLEQFEGVKVIANNGESGFVQADKPQALFSCEDTEYITWIDADCIVNGDVSELLLPREAGTVSIRFRKRAENRLRFRASSKDGEIPDATQALWRSDVGGDRSCQIETTCVTNVFTIHRDHLPFIKRWDELNSRVASKYGPSFPEAYCHSSGKGLSDELVLNALFAFAEDAPRTSEYLLDKNRATCLMHFGLNPKPWQRWTRETLRYYDETIAIIQYCNERGLKLPQPVPPHFTFRNKSIAVALGYGYSLAMDAARAVRRVGRQLLGRSGRK